MLGEFLTSGLKPNAIGIETPKTLEIHSFSARFIRLVGSMREVSVRVRATGRHFF